MKKINAINFTPKYDSLEDRIRLSINYNDIQTRVDFMITRSFIIKLFPILDDYILKYYNNSLDTIIQTNVPMNRLEKTMDKADSTTLTDGTDLALYKQEDELLIEVKFSYIKDNKQSIIQFISKKSQATVQINMDDINQIFNTLKSSIPFFSWGISHNF